METESHLQFDFFGQPRDFSDIEYVLTTLKLLENPDERWTREKGRVPTIADQQSFSYDYIRQEYERESKLATHLQMFYDSIKNETDLPFLTELEIVNLVTRFPFVQRHLDFHMGIGSPSVFSWIQALTSIVATRCSAELEYVMQCAKNNIEVTISYNDQFSAARYVAEEVIVPPFPDKIVTVDARTYVNKQSAEIPENIVDVVSAQCEVSLEKPLAVVFEVLDDDLHLKSRSFKRFRWDENGITATQAPIGLYSGPDIVRFDSTIGMEYNKDYLVLCNGVIRYATPRCYVTVFCDGRHILSRDHMVLGDTTEFGTWRCEMRSKRLVRRVCGQPDFFDDITSKLFQAEHFDTNFARFRGTPQRVNIISWKLVVGPSVYVFLGRDVKRNKILRKLKQSNITEITSYIEKFIENYRGCVYYGDRRLIVGEHKIYVRGRRIEFYRYPAYYRLCKEANQSREDD